MKRFKKLAAVTCLAVTVASSAVVFAGDHITNFNFDFKGATISQSSYKLNKKQTSFYTTADTYQDGKKYSTKFGYSIYLYSTSTFGSKYSGSRKSADGKQYQTYFKSVKDGNYKFKVSATDDDMNMCGARIKGNGEFWQD